MNTQLIEHRAFTQYSQLSNKDKKEILKNLLKQEADRGFAPYLYGLIPEMESIYSEKNAIMNLSENTQSESVIISKELIIKWIVSLCKPIFIFDIGNEDSTDNLDLFIVIDKGEPHSFKELSTIINTLEIDNHKINFTLCQELQFREYISRGSIFYINKCHQESMLYHNGEKDLPVYCDEELKKLSEEALRNFEIDFKKSNDIYAGAMYYRKKGNKELACFMLHQSTEIILRNCILALMSIDVKHHALKILLKHCSRMCKSFRFHFKVTRPEESLILKTLELSYSKSRYDRDFEVDSDILDILFIRVEKLLKQTYEFTVAQFK